MHMASFRFSELFPPIIALNKRRDQLLLETAAMESKLQKMEIKERTGANLLKVHEVLDFLILHGSLTIGESLLGDRVFTSDSVFAVNMFII